MAISVTDQQVTGPALEFARELAGQAAKVERLHARHPGADGQAREGGTRNGEAA